MTSNKRIASWCWVQTNVESTKLESFSLNFIWKWGSFDVLIILLFCLHFFFCLRPISPRSFKQQKTEKKKSAKIMANEFSKRWFRYNQVIIFHAALLFPSRTMRLYALFMGKTFCFCVLKQWMTRKYFVCCLIFVHYFSTLCLHGRFVLFGPWSTVRHAVMAA